jgi:hypothetical protein
MPGFKYLPPEEKRMYMVVAFGAAGLILGLTADAVPVLGPILFPLTAFCAAGFVAAFMSPAEKLFPLRSLPKRASPVLREWINYAFKGLLFFAAISLVLYLLLRGIRTLF